MMRLVHSLLSTKQSHHTQTHKSSNGLENNMYEVLYVLADSLIEVTCHHTLIMACDESSVMHCYHHLEAMEESYTMLSPH